jgi:ABC-2 type transport system permease protein
MNTTTHDRNDVTHLEPAAVTTTGHSLGRDLRLAVRQIGFEQRAFWRNRARSVFSIGFPLMFLVVFNAINGGHHIDELGGISYATWFVPGILAYGLMMATFSNLAISVTLARDTGVLKRLRGTSLPTWVYITGRVGSTLITAATLVAATLGLGVTAYGVHIRVETLWGLIATLVAGSVCFTVLGLAITAAIPNAEAAPAIVNLILLPLTFVSGIWMVLTDAPTWLDVTAKIFPVRAFAHGLQHAFDPATTGAGIVRTDLMVLAIWTLVGLRTCQRWFRWESRR